MNDLAPGFGCLPHLDRSGGYCGWASVAGPAYAGNDLNPFENAALRLNAESPIEERGATNGDFNARLCTPARL
jgi:hypothetical protein